MNHKIIFFDIDGTLVSEKTHTISDSTKGAIKKAQENGHYLFINTGRPLQSIDNLIKDLNFDGYICGCGTYVEFRKQILLHKNLGHAICKKIVQELRQCRIDAILEGKDILYYDIDDNIKSPEVKKIKSIHIKDNLYTGKTWDDENINFDKLTIFGDKNSDFTRFRQKFNNIFDFIDRGTFFYELVPKGYSKATGIEFIINHLDIPLENTYAIGDSTNDLSMLKYVKNSIAMGNSTPILFDYVSFVTKDIEDSGIEHALKHYNII